MKRLRNDNWHVQSILDAVHELIEFADNIKARNEDNLPVSGVARSVIVLEAFNRMRLNYIKAIEEQGNG